MNFDNQFLSRVFTPEEVKYYVNKYSQRERDSFYRLSEKIEENCLEELEYLKGIGGLSENMNEVETVIRFLTNLNLFSSLTSILANNGDLDIDPSPEKIAIILSLETILTLQVANVVKGYLLSKLDPENVGYDLNYVRSILVEMNRITFKGDGNPHERFKEIVQYLENLSISIVDSI